MTNLDKALADITAIRTQMARDAEFRGYGPATVAATGCVALVAAGVQSLFLPEPSTNQLAYLALWIATAAACVVLIGIEMVGRSRRIHSGLADEMIWAATGQLIPAGVAGALLTVVLFQVAPQTLWIVPGIWQIVFSLGFFASCRSLPRPMYAVAIWYLAAGLASLAIDGKEGALSPWIMGIPFGVGQFLMATVLYFSRESDAEV